jgi:hypothetical protein
MKLISTGGIKAPEKAIHDVEKNNLIKVNSKRRP